MKTDRQVKTIAESRTGVFAVPSHPLRTRGSGAPSHLRAALGGALAMLLVCLLVPSGASASQARLFAGSFGAAASTVPNPYPVSEFSMVAVDTSAGPSRGDVYLTDPGHNRVEKFDSEGNFLLMFGKEVNKGKVEAGGKTEAEQNLCAAGEECQPGTAAATPGAFASPRVLLVAVDGSAGPSAGDVYVAETSTEIGGGHGADLVTKFDQGGHLLSSWASGGRLDGSAVPAGPFHEIAGIAVDSSGNLWVADTVGEFAAATEAVRASEFKQEDGSLITSWGEAGGPGTGPLRASGLAIDPSQRLYVAEKSFFLSQWSPTGTRIGAVTSPVFDPDSGEALNTSSFPAFAAAVDPASGDIYEAGRLRSPLSSEFEPVIRRFDAASCHPAGDEHPCLSAETFGLGRLSAEGPNGGPNGLAVDSTTAAKPVYVAQGRRSSGPGYNGEVVRFAIETVPDVATAKATDLTGTSAQLNGTVDPSGEPLTQCFFEWGETTAYGHSAECEPSAAGLGSGTSPLAVHAQISGLSAAKDYHFRLVASNAATDLAEEPRRGADFAFGPPKLLAASALSVSSTSATLQAEVDPNSVQTTYRFEYDTAPYTQGEAPHGTVLPVPDGSLGSGSGAVIANQLILGLEPQTTYHYRLTATSVLGSVESPDHAFTTQPASTSIALPDNRGYELVSPPLKQGIPLQPISENGGLIQAAADGHAIAYFARGSIVAEPPGSRSLQDSQFLAARGASGWSTTDISTPHRQPAGVLAGNPSEYKLFSTDLSHAALEPFGATPLSPEAGERTPYLRAPDGTYTPLVYPGNVPAGTKFGGKEIFSEEFGNGVGFITATPDLSHLLLESPTSLVEGFKVPKGGKAIYEWSAGALTPVSYAPAGAETRCGGSGPVCVVPAGVLVGNTGVQLRNAISADGSRVFFSSFGGQLYLRDLSREETLLLSAPQGGSASSSSGAVFQSASADGSRVFFTDPERLTEDSTAAPGKPDLYLCEVELHPEDQLACDLTDLTANTVNPAEPAAVQGAVIGAAEDGSSVYFVANGALTAAPNSEGETAQPGQPNLYRFDVETGETRLLGVLSPADHPDWIPGEGRDLGLMTSRVSPNGRFLAFMSQRPLTGYDNRDAVTGVRDQEVFLYDSGAGRLLCASCNPTGARPHGRLGPPDKASPLVDKPANWEGQWYAANVPGWTRVDLGHALYQSRYLSDSGRLFFNANDALSPADSNGAEDVYQFEPPGVGSCSEESQAFAPRNGGCLSLISSGTSAEESAFMDASETGDDVFFLTASRLTARDEDGALDLYDARVGGGEAPAAGPVECSGDACQQPAVPPNDATPGSLTFNGAGNVLQCPKGKVKKSGKCVARKHRKAHKKHHQKSHKRANSNRGGHK